MRPVATLLAMFSTDLLSATPVWVGLFDASQPEPPAPWERRQLASDVPETLYRVYKWDGVNAVEATANKSMTLLARPLSVDLQKTPVLCWQWRVDAPLETADLRLKSGDDYAARVYLAFDIDNDQLAFSTRAKLALGRTLFGTNIPDAAVNYIWDNRNPINSLHTNAYTDRAQMLVVESGAEKAGRWVQERRNVQTDFTRAFGELDARIEGLAIASDTDNTGESARAGFANFVFVGADEACPVQEQTADSVQAR